LELVKENLLVVLSRHTEADPSLIPNRIAENTGFSALNWHGNLI